MKITNLRLRELIGTLHHEGEFWEERLIRPIDVYPEHRAEDDGWWMSDRLGEGRYRVHGVILEIETDEGVTGLAGPLGRDVAFLVDCQFRELLIGEDPIAIERLWDKMYRLAVHGRKGTPMMAISAIDCALWDLKGRWLNQPVYRLLGGPIRETFPAYASALGYSIEPEQARARVSEMVAQGYTATKWFVRHGPTDGPAGITRNLELMRTLREAAGPNVDVMLDAWMSWDVPYTVRMAELLREYRPRWIEEPVLPDNIGAYAEARRRSVVPIAGGEHEYTRWGIKLLLNAAAVDVLQPDIYWAGGLSELVKICTLASTYDIPVIPHGHSVHATAHLLASQPATLCPLLEYLIKWNQLLQFFWTTPLRPVNGMVTVPSGPGMGIEIDSGKVEEERELHWN